MSSLELPAMLLAFLRTFLALLLLAAAVPKLRAPDAFVGVVRNFRLLPAPLATAFARVLPWIELVLALALLWPASTHAAAWATAALMLLFALALGINLARGRRDIDCGCLRIGRDGQAQHISGWLVLRNLALAAGALLLAQAPVAGMPAAHAWAGALAAALAMLLYLSLQTLAATLHALPSSRSPRTTARKEVSP